MYHLTKKNLVAIGCIGAIVLASIPPQARADVEPTIYTQTLNNHTSLNLIDRVQMFKRLDAKIITTKPWLNPKAQKIRLSDVELRSILTKAGFHGRYLEEAIRIVWLESTNRPYALNKSSNCYGIFQINMSGQMGPDRIKKYNLSKKEDLFNPLINAKIAYHMSNGGKNWSAWTTAN